MQQPSKKKKNSNKNKTNPNNTNNTNNTNKPTIPITEANTQSSPRKDTSPPNPNIPLGHKTSNVSSDGLKDSIRHSLSKVREIKYNIEQWILIKSFIFSMLAVIAFVILAYFILDLIGGYLPVIALSILTSIAIRPTKDSISNKIKEFAGIIHNPNKKGPHMNRSFILVIYNNLKELCRVRKEPKIYKEQKQKVVKFFKSISLTTNVYLLLMICGLYILISRFGLITIVYVSVIYIVSDFIVRLGFDIGTWLINQIDILNKQKLKAQKSQGVSDAIESSVASFVIAGFLFLSISCVALLILMFVMDAETIMTNMKTSIAALIQTINGIVSNKFGIDNVIDERFVISFLRNYNESIFSYIQNDDMKSLYLSLSETLNNYTSNTTNTSFPGFSTIVTDLVSPHNNIGPVEMQECLKHPRFNFDYPFMHYVEYSYCAWLTFANKYSIDPYEVLGKVRQAVEIIFKLFFGTVVTQVFVISKTAIDYLLNFIFFCLCVYYLLQSKESLLHTMISLLPFDEKSKEQIQDFSVKSIKGSFLCSIKLFIYHFVFTWLFFDILDLELGFIMSIATAFCSIIPLVSPFILCIPHALYIYFARNQLILAILFPTIYMLTSNKVYNDVYEKSIDVHPYVTGLSIVMGIYAFNLQGIIYGPLLMCMVLIIYDVIKKYGSNAPEVLHIHSTSTMIKELETAEKDSKMGSDIDGSGIF